jgi:lysyl-tRNA synthetase class 2
MIDFTPPWPRLDYYQAVKEKCGIDLTTIKNATDLREQIINKKIAVHLEKEMGLGRMIDNLFKVTVRPGILQPTHLTGYPLATSPLAKLDYDRVGRVERFQVIVAGFEITNAYSELNDPQDQKKRFEEQAKLREAGDTEAHVNDTDFVQALEYGMPPTAGFGMGIDRVLALATNSSNVREVVFFPLLRPEK